MENPPFSLDKFSGMDWEALTTALKDVSITPNPPMNIGCTVMKLPKEDMKIFKLCPETDPFELVFCEVCNIVVKPQALLHHYELRHKDKVIDPYQKGMNIVSSSDVKLHEASGLNLHTLQCTTNEPNLVFGPSPGNDLVNVCEGNSVNVPSSQPCHKHSSLKYLSSEELGKYRHKLCQKSNKHTERLKRKPFSQLFANKLEEKKTLLMQKKLKKKSSTVLINCSRFLSPAPKTKNRTVQNLSSDRKVNIYNESSLLNNGNDSLPLSYTSNKSSISLIPNEPKPLSLPFLFLGHKAGGLLYSNQQMKNARHSLKFCMTTEWRKDNNF